MSIHVARSQAHSIQSATFPSPLSQAQRDPDFVIPGQIEEAESKDQQPPKKKRKRGRPKGSKNKNPAAPKPQENRYSDWMGTIYLDKCDQKTEQKLEDWWNPNTMHYMCGQEETGEGGMRHLQVFFQSKIRIRGSSIQNWLPNQKGDMKKRLGSVKNCIDYCSAQAGAVYNEKGDRKKGTVKEGSFLEFGGTPKNAGKSTERDLIAKEIKEGISIKQIFDDHTSLAILYHKGIERVHEVLNQEDDEPEFDMKDFAGDGNPEGPWEPIEDWTKAWVRAKTPTQDPRTKRKCGATRKKAARAP